MKCVCLLALLPSQLAAFEKENVRRGHQPAPKTHLDEIHLVYNRFVSMMTQSPEQVRLLPLEVVEAEESVSAQVYPLYEFEPDAETVLNQLLPVYI